MDPNPPRGWADKTSTAAPGGGGDRGAGGQAAWTARPGGGWAASPGALSNRRTAWGAVTAPRIRRGPPQRSHTRTSMANTRWSSRAQGHRPGDRAPASARASSGAGVGTIVERQAARGARTPWYASNGRRGGGTRAARRSNNSSGWRSSAVEPSLQGRLKGRAAARPCSRSAGRAPAAAARGRAPGVRVGRAGARAPPRRRAG